MESSGEPGKILVSAKTKNLVEPFNLYKFTKRQENVYCKSINAEIEAYFLEELEESQIMGDSMDI